jgi:hypothetical protein
LGIQQLRSATPHATSGDGHCTAAVSTHTPSQVPSQQKGSMLQTLLQQVASAQLGVACAWKQLPASGSPQSSQISLARIAQLASQKKLQQCA